MKIRAQIAMVLNLDKCIGCHTCSVTCKQVWTSREGVEYAWFNNVETKPGIGYPKDWENQDKWKGGWKRKRNGQIQPRIGCQVAHPGEHLRQPEPARDRRLLRALHLRLHAPADRAGERDHAGRAPGLAASPASGWRSSGARTGRRSWAREFRKRSKDRNFEGIQKQMYGQFENTFMFYLPRLCEHCLNPACVAACPSGSHLQARGGRHRPDRPGEVPRLAHVRLRLPVQENLLQLAVRQGGEVHLLLPAHRGRRAHRVLGDLRRPHPLPRRAAVRRRPHRGSGERRERAAALSQAARHLPRPLRPRR